MDAGLAKVLNSTVGTDKFNSLDKLLLGEKTIVGTDEPYYIFSGSLTNVKCEHTEGEIHLVDIALPYDGSVFLYQRVTATSAGDTNYAEMIVLKNGEPYGTVWGLDATEYTPFMLEGKKGDVFSVKLRAVQVNTKYVVYGWLSLQMIGASIREGKPIVIDSKI